MNDFDKVLECLVEGVVNYSSQHLNRHHKHTFTDISKNNLRKSQNLVPEYAKAKSEMKQLLDAVQKSGSPKIVFPNQVHQLLGKYKVDNEELKRGIPKQLGNMNIQIKFIPSTGNYLLQRI